MKMLEPTGQPTWTACLINLKNNEDEYQLCNWLSWSWSAVNVVANAVMDWCRHSCIYTAWAFAPIWIHLTAYIQYLYWTTERSHMQHASKLHCIALQILKKSSKDWVLQTENFQGCTCVSSANENYPQSNTLRISADFKHRGTQWRACKPTVHV